MTSASLVSYHSARVTFDCKPEIWGRNLLALDKGQALIGLPRALERVRPLADEPALGPHLCFGYKYKVIMTMDRKKFPKRQTVVQSKHSQDPRRGTVPSDLF